MTTASQTAQKSAARVLLGAGGVGLLIGLMLALVGAVVSGQSAFAGALTGALAVLGVFTFGTFTLNLVARVMPGLSLIFALLTYSLQVLLVGVFLLALDRAGALGDELSRSWTAAGIVGVTLAWTFGQILFVVKARIPLYELDENLSETTSNPVREVA